MRSVHRLRLFACKPCKACCNRSSIHSPIQRLCTLILVLSLCSGFIWTCLQCSFFFSPSSSHRKFQREASKQPCNLLSKLSPLYFCCLALSRPLFMLLSDPRTVVSVGHQQQVCNPQSKHISMVPAYQTLLLYPRMLLCNGLEACRPMSAPKKNDA